MNTDHGAVWFCTYEVALQALGLYNSALIPILRRGLDVAQRKSLLPIPLVSKGQVRMLKQLGYDIKDEFPGGRCLDRLFCQDGLKCKYSHTRDEVELFKANGGVGSKKFRIDWCKQGAK